MPRRKPPPPPPPPEQPSPGRWILLAAIVVSLLVLNGRDASAETSGAYGALGYSRILDELFGPMGWLELAPSRADAEAGPVVRLSSAAAAQRPVRQFLVESPLLRDLAARDERLWRISGSHVMGIDPGARRAPGPFDSGDRWTGDILYDAAPAPAELVARGGRVITLLRRPDRSAAVGVLPSIPATGPAERIRVAEVFQFVDEVGAPLGRVRVIGQSLVLFPEPVGRSAEILVEPGGRRADLGAVVIPDGGSIRFLRNGEPLGPALRLRQAPEGLSFHRAFGPRVTDLSLGTFGEAIERAVASSGLEGDEDVRLTLDGTLHLQLQQQLESYADTLLPATRGAPFRAAVTVMDTRSGELLALASYPARQPEGAREPAPEAWFAANHNFTALPIGSAAKVPVTAAILSQYPQLSRLWIQGSPGGFDRLFGIHLGRSIGETASAARIDFSTYLRQSSNKYAAALMLMGMSRDPWRVGPCRSDPYGFAGDNGAPGGERRYAPEFVLAQVEAEAVDARQGGRCGGAFGPVSGNLSSIVRGAAGSDWLSLFRTMFDIPGLEQPPSVEERFDVSIWSDYVRRDGVDPLAFSAVSPERESFGLGSIRDFQNDYVSFILGGVRSRWTTVKLAEAYSRIVMGRHVQAVFTRGNPVRGGAMSELHPDARAAILAGMEGVARPGGTAFPYLAGAFEALGARLLPGERLRLFAKTGTPSLARSRPIPARQALNNLASRGLITVEGRDRLTVKHKRPGQSDRDALLALPELEAEAERFGVTPEAIAREFVRLQRLIAERPMQLVGRDGIVRLPTSRITDEIGGEEITGGVIVVVLGRYCAGEQDPSRAVQALTVVVNVQARHDFNTAARLAGQLLGPEGELARRLLAGSAQCAPAPNGRASPRAARS